MKKTLGQIFSYIHLDGQAGVLADFRCDCIDAIRSERFQSLCHDVCLQICATAPLALSRDKLDPLVVSRHRDRFNEMALEPGRSESVSSKIAEGYLEKWCSESCLLEQAFVKESDRTVAQLIAETGAELGVKIVIHRFTRYDLTQE